MKSLLAIKVCFCLLLTSCGGGSPGSNPNSGPGLDTDTLNSNVGCTQEYYQTMLGKYTGVVTHSGGLSIAPQLCEWTATVTLFGNSIGPRCVLRAETIAPVIQMTFFNDDLNRYQCIDDKGSRLASEPLGPTFPVDVLPGLDNSQFPVEIKIRGITNADSGPYLGNDTTSAIYIHLFDGIQRTVADTIIVDRDGTMNIISDGVVAGTLEKRL